MQESWQGGVSTGVSHSGNSAARSTWVLSPFYWKVKMAQTSYEEQREELTPGSTEQRNAESPMTVRDAAIYLGVSPQTVYLWVERKQIPHLRVMGRNIRFLKSDLGPFRASFKREVENGKTE